MVDPPETFESTARQLGFRIVERVRLGELEITLYRLRIPAGTGVIEARQLLSSRIPNLVVDVNHQFEVQAKEDYLDYLPRALIGWGKATLDCGAGIRLGMIDASVDVKHPALAGRNVEFRSFHKPARRPGPADHGTAVAAIMVGMPDWGGLLPGAELKAANMFEMNEVGRSVGNAIGLLKSINWLAKKRVHVINLSIAGGNNKAVRLAFKRAKKRKLVMVAAAGNWGSANRPAYPAAYKGVVAVTALDRDKFVYAKANRGNYIDFAAPGVQVYTAVPRGGRLQSGTSFASPYLAVLVALEITRGIKRDSGPLVKKLSGRTVDLGDPGKDSVFGWGLVEKEPACN